MYIFKLFEKDQMHQPVDARFLQEGTMTIGRDPQADWVMNDPICEISRAHCAFSVEADALILRCFGANGVFDGVSDQRLPDNSDIKMALPKTIGFGPYTLVADYAVQARSTIEDGKTLILSPPLGTSIAVPTDWVDDAGEHYAGGQGSLLEAFCEGAGIHSSAFSGEDPEEIMARAGAVYRQMVLGIGDLMTERERVRGRYQLARTTIGGADNNPFKWAPTQRLAIDLLLMGDRGFLSGPSALKASFRDIKKHLIATFEGLRAALRLSVETFEPANVEEAAAQRQTLMKGKAAASWEIACERQAELMAQIADGQDGRLNRAFVQAYDAAASALEEDEK